MEKIQNIGKNIRNFIIKKSIELVEKQKFDKKTLGLFIRAYHISLPQNTMLMIMLGPQWAAQTTILFLMISMLNLIFLGGCFLSAIEQKLDNIDVTIMDPVLDYYNMEKNHKNRMKISYVVGPLFIAIAFSIYFYRFGFDFSIHLPPPIKWMLNMFFGESYVKETLSAYNNKFGNLSTPASTPTPTKNSFSSSPHSSSPYSSNQYTFTQLHKQMNPLSQTITTTNP